MCVDLSGVCMCARACRSTSACASEWARERASERWRERVKVCERKCVFVCVKERETESARTREGYRARKQLEYVL